MRVAASMVLSLAMILFGAELFTNAVEWLGRKLHLGEGAVGSVLAALGTALPETAVPITAIAFGHGAKAAEDVGIGGILGAPFLLVTLGSAIVACSLWMFRKGGPTGYMVKLRLSAYRRDMSFFLIAYALAIAVGCFPEEDLHQFTSWVLVGLYLVFIVLTFRDKSQSAMPGELHVLYLQWNQPGEPRMGAVQLQLVCALGLIVGGAHLLTGAVEQVALWWNIPPFVLSAILIPLATELPETLNSVVWIRQGKDALAIRNITGAMVFQSTLVPALGIALTKWDLHAEALLTGGLTLAAGAMLFGVFQLRGQIVPGILMAVSMLYWVLPLQTVATRYHLLHLYWMGYAILGLLFFWFLRRGLHTNNA
ncbi:sodium:calcium antiporter [Alicyclobacillus pomorum]|uniref:sodium:calcium antiporter n=1 Tax=Alicyclobacillus pomorum TaxID=204470 RepID=UPI0003F7F40B|nr:sodium:calcium antiporter [Alicyclobacillus pomorum]